jgi:hypothetical protein
LTVFAVARLLDSVEADALVIEHLLDAGDVDVGERGPSLRRA